MNFFFAQTFINTGPVVPCTDSGNTYEVILYQAENKEDDLGEGVGLEVWLTWEDSGSRQVQWSRKAGEKRAEWADWGFLIEENRTVGVKYTENDDPVYRQGIPLPGCKTNKITAVRGPKSSEEDLIKANRGLFRLEECKRGISTVT